MIANEKHQVARLEKANAYDHFLLDPYASRQPLSSKRTARSWDERRLVDIGQNQPLIVQRLIYWQGEEYFSELTALPWQIISHS
jgi:hypothetical protein